MTPDQERQVILLLQLRREYTLKAIARRFGCSVKTIYRVYQRHLTERGTHPSRGPSP